MGGLSFGGWRRGRGGFDFDDHNGDGNDNLDDDLMTVCVGIWERFSL